MTVLDREDIEALNNALYKIPKIVEKFAKRYDLALPRMGDVDFTSRAVMLEQACKVLKQMVDLLTIPTAGLVAWSMVNVLFLLH